MLSGREEELVARFYEKLFSAHPELQPMFARTEPKKQQQNLLAALKLAVANLDTPAKLLSVHLILSTLRRSIHNKTSSANPGYNQKGLP